MKHLFTSAGLVALAAGALSSYGQTPLVAANVPFAFHVGRTLLPAGEYRLSQFQDVLLIRAAAGKPAVMLLSIPDSRSAAASDGKLVFEHYGNEYFLRKIWKSNSDQGRAIPASKQERELASRVASEKGKEVTLEASNRDKPEEK